MTWLLLGGYLFTVTAAAQFHLHGSHCTHASSSLCSQEATAALAGIAQHCADHLSLDGQARGGVSSGVADDEDCPVCQFLAQSVMLVSIHTDVGWETLPEKAAVAEPVGRISRSLLAHRSRAPPVV
jgi:hypothetical protein